MVASKIIKHRYPLLYSSLPFQAQLSKTLSNHFHLQDPSSTLPWGHPSHSISHMTQPNTPNSKFSDAEIVQPYFLMIFSPLYHPKTHWVKCLISFNIPNSRITGHPSTSFRSISHPVAIFHSSTTRLSNMRPHFRMKIW